MQIDLQSFGRVLQTCNTINHIPLVKQLHTLLLTTGLLPSLNTAFTNRLLQAYTKCGSLSLTDARHVFDAMPEKNTFSWNTLLEGYMKSGQKDKSLELFNLMPRRNDFSWNVVILGFAKAGELSIARRLFEAMPRKNVVVWNCIIHVYARKGWLREAVALFKDFSSEVMDSDRFVLATVIGACTDMAGGFDCARQVHARIVVDRVEVDSVLGSSLVNIYGKCGDVGSAENVLNSMKEVDDFSLSAMISGFANCGRMSDAKRLFDQRYNRCVVLWNSMLAGYTANNEVRSVLDLFGEMRRHGLCGDFSTFSSVLSACSSLGVLVYCKQVHAHACKVGADDDVIVASALVDAYYKCGSSDDSCNLFNQLLVYDTVLLNSMITIYSNCGRIDDAKRLFETISCKSLISWNSMIVGLTQNGHPFEALDLFFEMNRVNLKMDNTTLASVISSCASISSFELGEQVFARATIIGLKSDKVICTSLVDFYCKCGFVKDGRKLFDEMMKFDEISWNSMLMGYATNGYGHETLCLFNEMSLAGMRPTRITFTAVLSACDHCGLVEEGRKWFYLMKKHYCIDPGIEHYSCMVDLFSRAGYLEEAMALVKQMPFEVDASMLSSVLRGCVAHGDKNLGKTVAERMIELDPENSGAYLQLSTILASSEDWDQSAVIRMIMREKQIRKNPGLSWADC